MKLKTAVLLLIMLAIAALTTLNWTTLATSSQVSLGVTEIEAPLGIILLALTILLGVFFLAYVFSLQGAVLLDTRRYAKDLQAQRDLADRAEASRLTELRVALESRLKQESDLALQHREALIERLDLLERHVAARLEQSDNTTAAYVGQLEERFSRRDAVLPPL